MKKFNKLAIFLLSLLLIINIAPKNISAASYYADKNFRFYHLASKTEAPEEDYTIALTDKSKCKHKFYNCGIVKEGNEYYLVLAYEASKTSPKADYVTIDFYEPRGDKAYIYKAGSVSLSIKSIEEGAIIAKIPNYKTNLSLLYFGISVSVDKKTQEDSELFKMNNPYYVPDLTIDTKELKLKPGDRYTINSNVDADCITWDSSDSTVATVDIYGNIVCLKEGTTTISASFGVTTLKCKVYVNSTSFPFYDVNPSKWYRSSVESAYHLGLMTGATETLFKPTVSMNRGMVAIVLHRMEGEEHIPYAPIFPDVYDNQYFTTAVMWAKQTGIITGYNNGTFMPLKNVTREEMATMIQRFAKYKGLDVTSSKDITYFEDYANITPYAREPIQWCVENGVISGKFEGTKVDPLGTATRAECAKMLAQAYIIIYKK